MKTEKEIFESVTDLSYFLKHWDECKVYLREALIIRISERIILLQGTKPRTETSLYLKNQALLFFQGLDYLKAKKELSQAEIKNLSLTHEHLTHLLHRVTCEDAGVIL